MWQNQYSVIKELWIFHPACNDIFPVILKLIQTLSCMSLTETNQLGLDSLSVIIPTLYGPNGQVPLLQPVQVQSREESLSTTGMIAAFSRLIFLASDMVSLIKESFEAVYTLRLSEYILASCSFRLS